jgi:threonine aldolase
MNVIDLRRDTITLPDHAMREDAFMAPLGDSVYGEDPTQAELERCAARLLEKEEVLEENAHIRTSETGGAACVGGLMLRGVRGEDGAPDPGMVETSIRADDIHYPKTSLICLESTHHRYGGIVPPLEKFERLREIADRHGLPVHLDGARLFNAALALGEEAKRIAKYADSVMFCLSKGLGAPVGSMLCGAGEFITRARRYRKMLGGGMRQTGWLCACGLRALFPENIESLARDHEHAQLLARGIGQLNEFDVDLEKTQTNYVVARLRTDRFDGPAFVEMLGEKKVLAVASGKDEVRFVTSKQVSRVDIEEALARIVNALEDIT